MLINNKLKGCPNTPNKGGQKEEMTAKKKKKKKKENGKLNRTKQNKIK